jgi:hypothetical protein
MRVLAPNRQGETFAAAVALDLDGRPDAIDEGYRGRDSLNRLSPGRVPGIAPLQPRPIAGIPLRREGSPAAVEPGAETCAPSGSSPVSSSIRPMRLASSSACIRA